MRAQNFLGNWIIYKAEVNPLDAISRGSVSLHSIKLLNILHSIRDGNFLRIDFGPHKGYQYGADTYLFLRIIPCILVLKPKPVDFSDTTCIRKGMVALGLRKKCSTFLALINFFSVDH